MAKFTSIWYNCIQRLPTLADYQAQRHTVVVAIPSDVKVFALPYGIPMLSVRNWLPTERTGKDNFFGVDRSVNWKHLGGWFMEIPNNFTTLEGFSTTLATMNFGGAASASTPALVGLLSPARFEHLKICSDKAVMIMSWSLPKVGAYESVMLNLPHGRVDVMVDESLDDSEAYLLTHDTWCIRQFENAASPDQLVCLEPFKNARLQFGPAKRISLCECGSETLGHPGHSYWCRLA